MKNLANCKPSEFLKQTFRIKKVAEEWLTATNILEIRKRVPELIKITNVMTDEEKADAFVKNKKTMREQSVLNFKEMLNNIMDENADKTLELMALCCFVEPEQVDEHPMSEYLESLGELLSDPGVISFFTSLVQLGQTNISNASKK